MSDNDLALLARYTGEKAEGAFAEIVRRHLDLVYSVALRQVRSPQLAEEVAQATFLSLAREANRLTPDTILAAWLYRVAHRTAANVVRREARRQLREQIASEMNAMNATADWTHIEPLLDEAMHALDETDRAAVLLRYFENKSLREVGQALGGSENAAQKRLTRAVERLREFFAKRGVTVGSSGLVVVISANAVQAAPVGLVVTISSAAALVGTTIATTATVTAIKAIAMTTLQKTLVGAALTAAVGTGIYEANRASTLRNQVQTLHQEQAALTEQIQQLTQARDEVNSQLALQAGDSERLSRATAELLRLRDEINRLRGNRGAPPQAAGTPLPPGGTEGMASKTQEDIAAGRELGMAVVRGEAGAFEKMMDLAKAGQTSFKTNSIGLNDTQRGDLARLTFAPLNAAFEVIAEAASAGNSHALNAVVWSAQIRELKGQAIQAIGKLAGAGDEVALETLLNPENYGFLQSSAVGALKPAAESGNQKAIDALAAVAGDPKRQGLWYMAADGLSKAAESGNAVAIDALVGLAGSTNQVIRRTIVPPLQRAAANQNAKATEALRSLRTQSP